MLVLGIDPGTATTGYGVVSSAGDTLALVAAGTIETPAGAPLPARLQMIYRGLAEVIRAWDPTEAAIEELFFSKNARTALAVGHGRGVVLLALADAGLPVSEYKPAQIKQAITGYGQADKRQMQEMVRLLLGLDSIPKPDDAADAIAVAICHMNTQRLGSLLSS